MCIAWLGVFPGKMDKWNIRKETPEKLQALLTEAQRLFDIVKAANGGTDEDKSNLKLAVKALKEFMRVIKKDTLHEPTLNETDFIMLKLKAPDNHPTPSGVPLATAFATITKIGRDEKTHEKIQLGEGSMAIETSFVNAEQKEPHNRQYCLQYTVLAAGIQPPTDFGEWKGLEIMTSRHHILHLGSVPEGSVLHCVMRVMNGKLMGDYGPVRKMVIS
jgi:hypothetical protein